MMDEARKLRVAVIAGEGGGDYVAVQQAADAGLIDVDIVSFITTSASSLALKVYEKGNPRPALVLDGFGARRQVNFETISDTLLASSPDVILLCGFTFILPPALVQPFAGKIINSHHSLLPAHPGLYRKEKLLQSDDKFLGATLHCVDEGVDTGRILYQCVFPNPGMQGLEVALKRYRFAQDCMMVQLIADQSNQESKERIAIFDGIYFVPGVEKRILDFFNGHYSNREK